MNDNFECPECGETFYGPLPLSVHSINKHREHCACTWDRGKRTPAARCPVHED